MGAWWRVPGTRNTSSKTGQCSAQIKLNAVCNDSSFARVLAGTMWVMFFVRLIPLCGMVIFGVYFLFFAVPVVTGRSWWRLRTLGKCEDPALKGARRYIFTSSTRRFWARPSAVSFDATGRVAP